jgi:predicted nucleic acid-binding protein
VIFIDSSAFYSILDIDDKNHSKGRGFWDDLLKTDEVLFTTNYVLIETTALVQRRIGLAAVRALHDEFAPALRIEWISEEDHSRGVDAALIAGRRKLSVIDCISFRCIRRHHSSSVFTFDDHFREQGFTVVP